MSKRLGSSQGRDVVVLDQLSKRTVSRWGLDSKIALVLQNAPRFCLSSIRQDQRSDHKSGYAWL